MHQWVNLTFLLEALKFISSFIFKRRESHFFINFYSTLFSGDFFSSRDMRWLIAITTFVNIEWNTRIVKCSTHTLTKKTRSPENRTRYICWKVKPVDHMYTVYLLTSKTSRSHVTNAITRFSIWKTKQMTCES